MEMFADFSTVTKMVALAVIVLAGALYVLTSS
jgi:hypothetical protein